MLACDRNGDVLLWDAKSGMGVSPARLRRAAANAMAWSPDGRRIALGCRDGVVLLWDVLHERLDAALNGHSQQVNSVGWSPDGKTLASCSADRTVWIWGTEEKNVKRLLRGHTEGVNIVAWSPDGSVLASASADQTIWIWDANSWTPIRILEGHARPIHGLSFSYDSKILASRADNVRLWRCGLWQTVGVLDDPADPSISRGLAFHPRTHALATIGDFGTSVRVWDYNLKTLLGAAPLASTVCYANAKVVLVGDTGVGKSGLGLVLSGQPFAPTESSHGRRVWTFDFSDCEFEDGRRETRETLLWDMAGQPGYRLVHQLHLNEVAVALIVFDARSETDPFAGVRHWDRALRQSQRVQGDTALPLRKFLVAARTDRGGIGVSAKRIEALKSEISSDGYFETSAKEGKCMEDLAQSIRGAINWDLLPKVASNDLFQRIKAFLLSEKVSGRLLSTVDDLFRAFVRSGEDSGALSNLRAQFETCIGRVEARDLIKRLSFGDFVLLQPEMLDTYASSLVNAAKEEPDGLGSIAEEDARVGRFAVPADERLKDRVNEKLLLIATVEDLLRHEIALREYADDGTHLVFPSQLTREHPDLPDPDGKAVVFTFDGPLMNIYATLAVRLSHSGLFERKDMWKNAVTYGAKPGGVCGMFLREIQEGLGELTLFFDRAASPGTRFQFEDYIHTHLRRWALPETITCRRIVTCAMCGFVVTDQLRAIRKKQNLDWLKCPGCGKKLSLRDDGGRVAFSKPSAVPKIDEAANTRRDRDAGLVSASGEMRTQGFEKWAGSSQVNLAIVFTDIVGSTALGLKLGNEAMGMVRRDHFQQARRCCEQNDGYEIKTIGDSFMVAFRTVTKALSFALALHSEPGHERVQIRAGIHVGVVKIEEEDAFGSMVNYTARIVGKAEGAEIWVSERAKSDIDEERAQIHSGLGWARHTNLELKGFPGHHRLWSIDPSPSKSRRNGSFSPKKGRRATNGV